MSKRDNMSETFIPKRRKFWTRIKLWMLYWTCFAGIEAYLTWLLMCAVPA